MWDAVIQQWEPWLVQTGNRQLLEHIPIQWNNGCGLSDPGVANTLGET